VTRTVGLPDATGDIGHWLEPLGLASLFVEAGLVAVSVYVLGTRGWLPSMLSVAQSPASV
jgi:hypothetical protein